MGDDGRVPIDSVQYPVNLVLVGKRCLVVGGGKVAARKVKGLLDAQADVHVLAPSFAAEIERLQSVRFKQKLYEEGDIAGYWLVIAATDDPAVNRQVFEDGERHGIWVNAADEPASCSFTLPAIARQGSVMAAVSTGGHSPALASWLRDQIADDYFDDALGELARLLSQTRERVQQTRTTEGLDWKGALDDGLLDLFRDGKRKEAVALLDQYLKAGLFVRDSHAPDVEKLPHQDVEEQRETHEHKKGS